MTHGRLTGCCVLQVVQSMPFSTCYMPGKLIYSFAIHSYVPCYSGRVRKSDSCTALADSGTRCCSTWGLCPARSLSSDWSAKA